MRSIGMRLGALSAFVDLALCGSTLAAIAQQPTPADLVDALNGVFGKHAGDRAAHTKGICLTGSFTPSAEAPKLSKAAHFAKQVPIRARFSLGGGNPNAPRTMCAGLQSNSISAMARAPTSSQSRHRCFS